MQVLKLHLLTRTERAVFRSGYQEVHVLGADNIGPRIREENKSCDLVMGPDHLIVLIER
jgi:hypothetical protein